MKPAPRLPAIVEHEDDVFVALARPWKTPEAASLRPLLLFFETAALSEVTRRFRNGVFVTQVEVPVWRRPSPACRGPGMLSSSQQFDADDDAT